MNAAKRAEIYRRLAKHIPNPDTELHYATPFELLIAVILSAQATDVGVNQATDKLYPVANTPQGIFSIIQKRRRHYSNIYRGAPMPYMQRLTWGGIAMHAGELPGYPASAGCVRLPLEFSEHRKHVLGAEVGEPPCPNVRFDVATQCVQVGVCGRVSHGAR